MASNFYVYDGAAMSSTKMDWATPQWLFDKLNDEFHFDIDVCADETNAKCDKYFSEEDSCLEHNWGGEPAL